MKPLRPFHLWPRQWTNPDYGFGWLILDPPTIVTQSVHSIGGVAGAVALHDFLDECVALGFLEQHPTLTVLHDWRSLGELDAAAREVWASRSQRPGHPYASAAIYIATSAQKLIRMNLQVGGLSLQLDTKIRAPQMIDHPQIVLTGHGIRAPLHGTVEKLRARAPSRS